MSDQAIRQLKRQVDQLHSTTIKKFRDNLRKRDALAELVAGVMAELDKINLRIDELEKELNDE